MTSYILFSRKIEFLQVSRASLVWGTHMASLPFEFKRNSPKTSIAGRQAFPLADKSTMRGWEAGGRVWERQRSVQYTVCLWHSMHAERGKGKKKTTTPLWPTNTNTFQRDRGPTCSFSHTTPSLLEKKAIFPLVKGIHFIIKVVPPKQILFLNLSLSFSLEMG